MSVATEIQRLQTAKADIKTAIENKGVQVPSNALLSTYNIYINQIVTGGGGGSSDLGAFIDRSITSVTIPTNITTIGDYAFSSCHGLTSIVIPSNITSIGNRAFGDCSGLTSVTIPNTVTTIDRYAFYFCTSLTSVAIPNSVTTIGYSAFQSCEDMTTVTIGNGVTTIGNLAFQNCTSLTSFTITATTPPTLGSSALGYTYPIYVPSGSVEAYKTASGWSTYASQIQAIPA